MTRRPAPSSAPAAGDPAGGQPAAPSPAPASPKASSLWIVIPAYNAAASLGQVIAGVRAATGTAPHPLLVVDDGSTDRSAEVAERAGALVLRHAGNRGKGAALQTGFAYALQRGADAVLTLDADGQHDPHEIVELIAAYRRTPGSFVMGVRSFDRALMPRRSRIGNQISTFFISRFAHRPHRDTQSGFRIYPRTLLQTPLRTRRFDTETELVLWASKLGVPLREVPIQTLYSDAHVTHFRNWEDTLRVLRLVIGSPLWRTPAPPPLSTVSDETLSPLSKMEAT